MGDLLIMFSLSFIVFSIGIIIFFLLIWYILDEIEDKELERERQGRQELEVKDIIFLEKNFTYYHELLDKDKNKFVKRMNKFIESKTFEGRQNLVITREMKILIAATGIKLTFGFKTNYLFDGLQKIIIYPNEYFSKITKTQNKGESSSAGYIVFSWTSFLYGLKKQHDNINLGFHEFTHALLNEGFIQASDAYEILCKEIEQGNILKESRNSHLFRDYAYVNKIEFISCVVETFFESPDIIYRDVPLLYHIFSNLLNQDPLNKSVLLFTDDDLKDITI